MSTMSCVGFYDGAEVSWIEVWYDGYPEGVGKVLVDHYTAPDAIRALLRRGELVSLGATPEASERDESGHPYDTVTAPTLEAAFARMGELARGWIEFMYIYYNAQWHYVDVWRDIWEENERPGGPRDHWEWTVRPVKTFFEEKET